MLLCTHRKFSEILGRAMAFPLKVRRLAIQLHEEEGLSAEKIVDKWSKEVEWRSSKIPDPRTIRNWISEVKQKRREGAPEQVELKREHDKRIFTASDNIMSEQDLHSFPLPIRMPEFDKDATIAVGYVIFPPFREKLSVDDAIKKMYQFIEFFRYESNKYFEPKLNNYCEKLCDILGQIAFELDIRFGEYKADIDKYFTEGERILGLLKPVMIHKGDAMYHPHKRLAIRFQRAQKAYEDYRIAVRDTLLL